jgi:hypothetical protein
VGGDAISALQVVDFVVVTIVLRWVRFFPFHHAMFSSLSLSYQFTVSILKPGEKQQTLAAYVCISSAAFPCQRTRLFVSTPATKLLQLAQSLAPDYPPPAPPTHPDAL